MPSERPVRSASSSSAAGCLPCPRCQEPWPNAGTTAPVGNFTVRLAPLEAAPLAGWTADASDDTTQEPSATQSPLNSRRFTNRIFAHYTIPPTAPIVVGRDGATAVVALRLRLLAGTEQPGRRCQNFGEGGPVGVPRESSRCVPTPCRTAGTEPRFSYGCGFDAPSIGAASKSHFTSTYQVPRLQLAPRRTW